MWLGRYCQSRLTFRRVGPERLLTPRFVNKKFGPPFDGRIQPMHGHSGEFIGGDYLEDIAGYLIFQVVTLSKDWDAS